MHSFYLNITHKSQQRDKKTLEEAIKSVCPKESLDDFLQVPTITNCINNIDDFKLSSNIDAKNTKIYFYHGTAVNEKLARKSAKYILKKY